MKKSLFCNGKNIYFLLLGIYPIILAILSSRRFYLKEILTDVGLNEHYYTLLSKNISTMDTTYFLFSIVLIILFYNYIRKNKIEKISKFLLTCMLTFGLSSGICYLVLNLLGTFNEHFFIYNLQFLTTIFGVMLFILLYNKLVWSKMKINY